MLKTIPSLSLILGIIGAVLYFLHPDHSLRSLSEIKLFETSWLNREMLFTYAYLGFLVLFMAFTLADTSWKRMQKVLLDITGIAGIILIYVMSRVYALPPHLNWPLWYTPLCFYSTTLTVGALLLLLLITHNGSYSSQKALAGLAAVIIIAAMILIPFLISFLKHNGISGENALQQLMGRYAWLFFGRILFQLISLIFVFRSILVIRSEVNRCRLLFIPILIAFLSLILAESFGRILFFTIDLSQSLL